MQRPSGLRKWRPRGAAATTPVPAGEGVERAPPWHVYAGVFVVQFFLPGVLISHGVYLSHLLQQHYHPDPFIVVWPPAIFLATWCLSRPYFRTLGEKHQGRNCRILACIGTLLLSAGLAASTLAHTTILRAITFGIVGGLGCSLAVSQSEAQLRLHLRPSAGLCLNGVALALGHFAAPLIMMSLVSNYGSAGAPLVQAAIALHGLVGALFFRKKTNKFKVKITPSPTQDPDEDEEVVYMRVSVADVEGDLEAGLGARSWKNPSMDALDGFGGEDETESPGGRARTHNGVEIMPQILEEDEEEEVVLDFTQRRLSVLKAQNRQSWAPPAPLEIYSHDQQDSTVDGMSPLPLLTPSSSIGQASRSMFTFEAPASHPWGRFCTRLGRNVTEFLRSACQRSVLPSIFVGAWSCLEQLVTSVSVPVVANQVLTYRRHEGAFALAVLGFGWLCTCICAPCFLLPAARRQRRLLFSVLHLISSAGFALLSEPGSHDRLTLGCVVVGMTHGALLNLTPAVHHALWGTAQLSAAVHGIVDGATALIVVAFVGIACHFVKTEMGFSRVFLWLAWVQLVVGLVMLLRTMVLGVVRRFRAWTEQN